MDKTEHRSFGLPTRHASFPRGRAEILNVGGARSGGWFRARMALVQRREADRRHRQL